MSAFAKKSAKFGAQIAPVIKETDLSSKTLLFFREVRHIFDCHIPVWNNHSGG